MIPRIFEGQRVAIVAGGPSLRDFDFDRLRRRPVIAINRAHEVLPEASVLWWSDVAFWRRNREALLAHAARWKATCQIDYEPNECPGEVTTYRFTGRDGFDPDPACLRHGNNSGYAALHLAVHLGATSALLLGYDMRYGSDGASHFHGGHGVLHREATLTKLMAPFFSGLVEPLADRGFEVRNASPDSGLTLWPRCTGDDGLAWLDAGR